MDVPDPAVEDEQTELMRADVPTEHMPPPTRRSEHDADLLDEFARRDAARVKAEPTLVMTDGDDSIDPLEGVDINTVLARRRVDQLSQDDSRVLGDYTMIHRIADGQPTTRKYVARRTDDSSLHPTHYFVKMVPRQVLMGDAITLSPDQMRDVEDVRKRVTANLVTASDLIRSHGSDFLPASVVRDLSYADGPYFVEEFVLGIPLSQVVADNGGRLKRSWAVSYARQMLVALRYLHNGVGRAYVHGDVKTSNFLVVGRGPKARVVLTDFDTLKGESEQITRLFGTPGYTPPEVIPDEDREAKPSMDVFGWGVVFYRMLTGVDPFSPNGRDWPTYIMDRTTVADVSALNGDRLQPLIKMALSMSPSSRPTVGRLIELLDEAMTDAVQQPRVEPVRAAKPHRPVQVEGVEQALSPTVLRERVDDLLLQPGPFSFIAILTLLAGMLVGVGVLVGIEVLV